MATISRLITDVVAKTNRFDKPLKKSGQRAKKFAAGIGKAFSVVGKAIGILGGLAAAGLAILVKQQFKTIDATAKMADTLGLTNKELIGFQQAARITGVGQNALSTGIKKLQKNIADAGAGLTTSIRAFEKLGLNFKELEKLSPSEQFLVVTDALNKVEKQTDKTQVALDIFGRAGLGLIKIAELGTEGLLEFRKEAERLGIALSRIDAAKIEGANDAVERAKQALRGFANAIAVSIAPFVTNLASVVKEGFIFLRTNVLPVVFTFVNKVVAKFREFVTVVVPFVIVYGRIWFKVFSQVIKTLFVGLKAIANFVGKGIGLLFQLGTGTNSFKDGFITAISVVEFVTKNFGKIMELAVSKIILQFLRAGAEVEHIFKEVIPSIMAFGILNWKAFMEDYANIAVTVFTNLFENLAKIVASGLDLITGKVNIADLELKGVTEGFVPTDKIKVEIPSRVKSATEQFLEDDIESLKKELSADFLNIRDANADLFKASNDKIKKLLAKLLDRKITIDGLGKNGILGTGDEETEKTKKSRNRDTNKAIEAGSVAAFQLEQRSIREQRTDQEQVLIRKAVEESLKVEKAQKKGIDKLGTILQAQAPPPQEQPIA